MWETRVFTGGAAREEVLYFDTLKEAQEHLDARVGRDDLPTPAPKKPVSVKKIKETPWRRKHWRPLKDGSYSRKQGDLHGVVEEIAHNGAFRATFFDGEKYVSHEFVGTGEKRPLTDYYTGAPDSYTISLNREDRKEKALAWIDAQFDLPSSKARLKKPLSATFKKKREAKIRKAISEGQFLPEMSREDRKKANLRRVILNAEKNKAERATKKVTVIRARTRFEREGMRVGPWRRDKMKVVLGAPLNNDGTAPDPGIDIGFVRRVKTGANDDGYSYYVDVPGEAPGDKDYHTDLQAAKYLRIRYEKANPPAPRSSSAHGSAYRPVPIAPPFSGSGEARTRGAGNTNVDDNIPIDEDMTWTGWVRDKRQVRRGTRHIGQVRRVATGKDRAGKKTYTYFADVNGRKPSKTPFPNDWQAARHLFREDRKKDGERLLFPEFIMPEGHVPAPFLGENVSWRLRPGNRYDIAVYGENIGFIKQNAKGRWGIYPKDVPAMATTPPSARRAGEVLVSRHHRERAKWKAEQAAASIRATDPTPEPKPLKKRVRPQKFQVTEKPGAKPFEVTATSVVLEPGAGLPSGTIPKAIMTPKEAMDDFLNSGSLNEKPRVRRSGKTSVVNKPLPRSAQKVPYIIRDQYDLPTKNAVQQFEKSSKVPRTVIDRLRRLEASGQYRWVYVVGKNPTTDGSKDWITPNGEDAWVFVRREVVGTLPLLPPPVGRRRIQRPSGATGEGMLDSDAPDTLNEILAMSQPEFDNFLFDKYRIEDTVNEEVVRLGESMPTDQAGKSLEGAVSDSAGLEG